MPEDDLQDAKNENGTIIKTGGTAYNKEEEEEEVFHHRWDLEFGCYKLLSFLKYILINSISISQMLVKLDAKFNILYVINTCT